MHETALEALQKRLKEHALKITRPFCYPCYEPAPSGRCAQCASDDLMRELPGYEGAEYGTQWVIETMIAQAGIAAIDWEERFDEFVNETHCEIEILGCTYLPSEVLRELDPVAYDVNCRDFRDGYEDEIIEIGNHDYSIEDLDNWLTAQED